MRLFKADRIDALDGVRGIAMLFVLVMHWIVPYQRLIQGGYVAVDVFFVLSGFLITTILWRGRGRGFSTWWRFEWGRWKRLYPALLASLVVGVGIAFIPGSPMSPQHALAAAGIVLVQGSSIVASLQLFDLGYFAAMWSLSIEWVFYLAWGPAMIWARHRMSARAATICTLVLAGLLASGSLLGSGEWFYRGLTSRSAEILLGCALALAIQAGILRGFRSWAGLVGVGLLVGWTLFGTENLWTAYRLIGYPLAALGAVLVVGTCVRPGTWLSRPLSWRPIVLAGRVSYSIYLWHFLVSEYMRGVGLPLPISIVIVGLATIALTTVSFMWFERPYFRAAADRSAHANVPRTGAVVTPR